MKRLMSKWAPQRGASTVAVHGALAALALTAAYLTWTRDKAQAPTDQVAVLSPNKRDVQSVTYDDPDRSVVIERKLDEAGEAYTWVTVTTKAKELVTNSPAAVQAAPAPAPAGGDKAAPAAGTVPAGAAAPAPAAPAAPAPGKAAPAPAAPAPAAPAAPAKGGDKAAGGKDGEKAAPAPAKNDSMAPQQIGTIKVQTPKGPRDAAVTITPLGPPVSDPSKAVPGGGAPIHEIRNKAVTKSFRGSDQADKLVESFAPLMALRALGKLDDAKAKELGLTESKKTLTVQLKSEKVTFTFGTPAYGSGDIYVRDSQGQVFLLPARFQNDFEYAESRLMERRLHRFERADISSVEMTIGAKKKVLVQQKRMDPAGYYFAEEATPDKRDDTLRNWMDKVLRIAINDYVAKGDEPKMPEMSQPAGQGPQYGDVITMRFFDGKKPLGFTTFSRYPSKGGGSEYFAKTETTIGLVKLLSATAESAIQDAEKW